MSATPAGQCLVEEVGPLARALDESIARLARGDRLPTGAVRIAVAPGFGRACIVPVMRTLRVEHLGISVEFAVSDPLANVVAENIDLAVRSGVLGDSSHVARRLGETPLLTMGSAAYFARHREPREPSDLREHDCVVFFKRTGRLPRPARLASLRGGICQTPASWGHP